MTWHLLPFVAIGWIVRIPLVGHEEGHEAITRAAWEGLGLTAERRRALIRGVRAPDIGLGGLLTSALPFAQRRHALRAWSGSSTADGIHAMRDFMTSRHLLGLGLPDGARRWESFGQVLHCLQDSYSPAHTDRAGTRIARMKHWGPLDRLRSAAGRNLEADEHRFPTDRRDSPWRDGTLTDEARAAADTSRRYLEIVLGHAATPNGEGSRSELEAFLDEYVAR